MDHCDRCPGVSDRHHHHRDNHRVCLQKQCQVSPSDPFVGSIPPVCLSTTLWQTQQTAVVLFYTDVIQLLYQGLDMIIHQEQRRLLFMVWIQTSAEPLVGRRTWSVVSSSQTWTQISVSDRNWTRLPPSSQSLAVHQCHGRQHVESHKINTWWHKHVKTNQLWMIQWTVARCSKLFSSRMKTDNWFWFSGQTKRLNVCKQQTTIQVTVFLLPPQKYHEDFYCFLLLSMFLLPHLSRQISTDEEVQDNGNMNWLKLGFTSGVGTVKKDFIFFPGHKFM